MISRVKLAQKQNDTPYIPRKYSLPFRKLILIMLLFVAKSLADEICE
jgi:hypothetical protein